MSTSGKQKDEDVNCEDQDKHQPGSHDEEKSGRRSGREGQQSGEQAGDSTTKSDR